MKARTRSGLTLLEAMVTMLMAGVMMLCMNLCLRDLQRQIANHRDYDRHLAAHQSLDRLGQFLRSSHRIVEPTTGSSARLVLSCWDPAQHSTRLPATLAPESSAWASDDPAFLLTRRFEVVDGVLLCTQQRGASSESIRMQGEVDSFQVQRLADGFYRLTLRWRDQRYQTRTLSRQTPGRLP